MKDTSHLTLQEEKILAILKAHAGEPVSREDILRGIWGDYSRQTNTRIIDVYIGYLRRKIGSEKILTVSGKGYAYATHSLKLDEAMKAWQEVLEKYKDDSGDLFIPPAVVKPTRVEVIDETGRAYVRWNANIKLSFQDQGRTLKIFVENAKKPGEEGYLDKEEQQILNDFEDGKFVKIYGNQKVDGD